MNSHRRPIRRVSLALLLGLASTALVAAAEEHDNAKLLAALPKSKMTLAQGIAQAAKTPEAAVSAKFELDDKGALSLSVYTAEKGLGVEPDHNVLKELSGSPEAGAWKPETEVFKDVEHVSRSAEHLTLAALSPHPLAHIVAQAEKDQPGGTVFSITPALKDRKPVFVVQVADKGKVVELNYDLMTGQKKSRLRTKTLSMNYMYPTILAALLAAAVLGLTPTPARAQAGPPLVTDDPGTPGSGVWEINVALTLEQSRIERAIEAPLLDINYGWGDHVQLKYEVAFLVLDERDAGPIGGLSNSLLGVKWRFLDEDKHGVAMSVYPQLELNYPTKSIRRGFVESGTTFLLPVQVAKTFGKWEVGAEVGYEFVQHADDQWIYGVAVGYALTEQIELLGEVHGTVDEDFRGDDVLLNLGTRWTLNDRMTFLFAASRSFRDASESANLLVYAGLQLTF